MHPIMTLSEYLSTAGRTREELAAAIGSDVSSISLWANGKRHPAAFFAVRIESATGGAVPVTSWPTPVYARSSPRFMTRGKTKNRARHGRAAPKSREIARRSGATR